MLMTTRDKRRDQARHAHISLENEMESLYCLSSTRKEEGEQSCRISLDCTNEREKDMQECIHSTSVLVVVIIK